MLVSETYLFSAYPSTVNIETTKIYLQLHQYLIIAADIRLLLAMIAVLSKSTLAVDGKWAALVSTMMTPILSTSGIVKLINIADVN